jgi:cyclophilin family peptidyl-prolyl cis-trans isomerase
MQMTVETSKGTIVIQLDPASAPNTIQNLRSKADSGFFNGLTFHRVEHWVIQGGDPTGSGSGGGKIASEYNNHRFVKGAVGIARGPDRRLNSDCQWFIVKTDSEFLNGDYTHVGQVTQGMDVVEQIRKGDKMTKVTITDDAPAGQ